MNTVDSGSVTTLDYQLSIDLLQFVLGGNLSFICIDAV